MKNTLNCFRNNVCKVKCLKSKNTLTIKLNYTKKDMPGPFPYSYEFMHFSICKISTYLFVYIISGCNESIERNMVRETWGKNTKEITIRYIIGIGNNICSRNYFIEYEKYGDIYQINISESFANETLFSIYTMKHLKHLCPYANFYAKFDVDTFVNLPKLYEILRLNEFKKLKFWGAEVIKWKKVNSDSSYKYSSSKEVANYYNSIFPKNGIDVYSGFATVFTSDLPNLIYNQSLKYPNLIRIDDQYISWLLYILNIKIYEISSHAILPNKCKIFKNATVIHRIKSYDLVAYYTYIKEELKFIKI